MTVTEVRKHAAGPKGGDEGGMGYLQSLIVPAYPRHPTSGQDAPR